MPVLLHLEARNLHRQRQNGDIGEAVVNDLYAKDGAAASDLNAPLQRFWRDANAAALHLSLDWEAIASMYGQHKLGLEPVGVF